MASNVKNTREDKPMERREKKTPEARSIISSIL